MTKKNEKKDLLAYCGIYCGDCLGYTGIIARSAEQFKQVLDKYRFDKTIACVLPDKQKDYTPFVETLGFMTGLKCPAICRSRKESEISCDVRACCINGGFYACFQCDDFEDCEKLKSLMGGLHYQASQSNLKTIREKGMEKWLSEGPRHCYWNEQNIP